MAAVLNFFERIMIALVLTFCVAAAAFAGWAWMNRPLAMPESPPFVTGFAYSAFQRDQDPGQGRYPSDAEIDRDLTILSQYTDRIRTYMSTENPQVPALAARHGLKVAAGAWLDRRFEHNDDEIAALIRSARENRSIDRVIVGNETLLRGDLTPPQLINYLKQVKRRVRVPVTTAEPWHVWMGNPELVKNVDFITVHLLPYWEGMPPAAALDYCFDRLDELQRTFPRKRVVIGEIGWPSRGNRILGAEASPQAQAEFVRGFLAKAEARNLDYYVMEAFDQPWKAQHEGPAGAYWGLFNANRTPKFELAGRFVTDPSWPMKALLSMGLAVPFVLAFCVAFRRFRLPGRVFYACLIQAAAALLVWLVALPFEFYLRPIDWIGLLVLVPAALAMIGILLANGFEFTEAMWRRYWQREFRPLDTPVSSANPFVSVHLATCNEPPEMVMLTLDSLARLDYENYEVLVIDNNTRDEALWQPVAAHVEKLGAKFRFFHLPKWPGFKAGALNFALEHTDPRAEVVGVVDADYVVEPQWLRTLVGHFDSPRVAVVQAPQAHRGFARNPFQRMCNWEFDGFFRIGMHHRNERDAIIQHGTMTLVRRSALTSTGNWSEWCICEDAELGLRLMQHGYETRYVDEVLGRGLTPSTFKAFKSQRMRWAFGAMQIMKKRWSWMTRPGPLSGGQRFHFLTGWFTWFADALHLVFTFGAIAWTIGMLVAPGTFTLPLDLFLIPILGFLVVKAVFGPVLYRERVNCSWLDVIGASIASMGLSHAIARGIFAGLWQREGVFTITAKGKQASTGAYAAVREESLMLTALGAAVAALLWKVGLHHREAWLWVMLLAGQSIPYVASLVSAHISVLGARRTEQSGAAQRLPSAITAAPVLAHLSNAA